MAGSRLQSSLPATANTCLSTCKNSLFAEVEKQKTTYKRHLIHRLVYIARINQISTGPRDAQSAISDYYEEYISKFQRKTQTEGVTGMLLIYPKSITHVLESSFEILTEILRDLSHMEQTSGSLLKDSRILVVSHCLPSHTFPSWGSLTLNQRLSVKDSTFQTQPLEVLIADNLATIYKLCTFLLRRRVSCASQDPHGQTPVLEEETVIHLCQSSVLHSPSSFLQAYRKPVSLLMDSEIVWPTQRRIYW